VWTAGEAGKDAAVDDEQYRNLTVALTTGRQATRSVDSEDEERLVLQPSMVSNDKAAIGKSMIQ